MATVRVEAENERIEAEVPQSLLDFIAKWAKEGEHAQEHCMLSILSHGLMHMCVINAEDVQLRRLVTPILRDIACLAPKDAVVVEVDYNTAEQCPNCGQYH